MFEDDMPESGQKEMVSGIAGKLAGILKLGQLVYPKTAKLNLLKHSIMIVDRRLEFPKPG
jgi:hypothetical protein